MLLQGINPARHYEERSNLPIGCCCALMNVSPLIAAEAHYFFLDEKVTKNQDEKIFPPTRPLPIGPGFSSAYRSLLSELCRRRCCLFS